MNIQAVDANKKWKKQEKTEAAEEHVDIGSDGTYDDLASAIDITDIVDDCFKEEQKKGDHDYVNQVLVQKYSDGNARKRRYPSFNIQVRIDERQHSVICFTIEEEFRVHDLIAKREFMNDINEQIKTSAASSLNENVSTIRFTNEGKIAYGQKLMDNCLKLGQHIASTKFQDVFDEFRHVRRSSAFE